MPANKEAMTLVVISSLFVIMIYSSVVKFNAFGQNGSYEHCNYMGQYPPVDDLFWTSNCCWSKTADSGILAKATPPIMVCQICKGVGFQKQCSPAHQRVIATLRPAGPQQPPPNFSSANIYIRPISFNIIAAATTTTNDNNDYRRASS